MSHVGNDRIHAFVNRGLDLRAKITTTEAHTDFTDITFRGAGIEKAGLTADDTTEGFDVDFTLTAADMAISHGSYRWELFATFGGQVRTLIEGQFTVDPEPTE